MGLVRGVETTKVGEGEDSKYYIDGKEFISKESVQAEINKLVDIIENVQAFNNPAVRIQAERAIAKHRGEK